MANIEIGDMVKIHRSGPVPYTHWGICVGDDEMVHLSPNNSENELDSLSLCLDPDMQVVPKRQRISGVAHNCSYSADNYLDGELAPRSKADIAEFALSYVKGDRNWKYNLVLRNCEKFAIWCRYRVDNCIGRQAETGITVGVIGGALLVAGVGALIGHSVNKSKENKEKESPY